MSGHGFHVHGPHDHELEHAAQHGAQDRNAGLIAVSTAVIATIGAMFAYEGGATQANATLFKNNAAIKKTEAANQWAYYQAKSGKQNLAELGAVLAQGEPQAAFQASVARYEKEKAEIKARAEALDKESQEWDAKSEAQMHTHHRWAQATTALQIAIALAAISLLTRRAWLRHGMFAVAALGVGLGVAAAMHL